MIVPGAEVILWALIGTSSIAAVITGVAVNRPRLVLPWLLVAAALLVLTAGDAVFYFQTHVLGEHDTFPSLNDYLYLGMYPLLIAGLVLLPRSTTPRDRGGLIDALILTTGIGLLAWIFVVSPDLHHTSPSTSITSLRSPTRCSTSCSWPPRPGC